MRVRKYEYYACDFETTVYDGQEVTEVWAAACVKLKTEDVKIFHSISEIYDSQAPFEPGGTFSQGWSVSEVLKIVSKIK